MPPQPQSNIIRKSIFGLVGIYILGTAAALLLIVVAIYIQPTMPELSILLLVAVLVVILAASLAAYSYNLSRLILTKDRLIVDSWNSLLLNNDTVTEWDKVQDVNVKERGILAQMFGYGTLTVESSSGDGRLTLPYVPNPDHWRDVMIERMQSAAQPVHEV